MEIVLMIVNVVCLVGVIVLQILLLKTVRKTLYQVVWLGMTLHQRENNRLITLNDRMIRMAVEEYKTKTKNDDEHEGDDLLSD